MHRRLAVLLTLLLLAALLTAPAARALTDTWAGWTPLTGRSNDYAGTMQQASTGFPRAVLASDSRSNVQLPSGASTFLGTQTPPGAKYGSSRNASYVVLRPRADTPTGASTTTYTFDAPTPDTGWAFVLGDVDADRVQVRATDADGTRVPAAEVSSWFAGTFNYAGGTDVPTWDGDTSTLEGNAGAVDTDGAAGWFEPTQPLTSLTFVFTRRAGFPVYQTWFVSRARPIGGQVSVPDDATLCDVTEARLTLTAPSGEVLATTSPDAGGAYSFGELATQAGYVVRITPGEDCVVDGPAQDTSVDNRGEDDAAGSRADFALADVVPQPISGTVREGEGPDGPPVAGATVTLTRPDGSTAVTTTAPDGSYLFDENPRGAGYTVALSVPPGYAAGDDGTELDVEVAGQPLTGRDFGLRRLPAVTGTVTGGGNPLGGVAVRVTPVGGGQALTAVTDGEGRYAVDGLPAGDYTVEIVRPEGYGGDDDRAVTVARAAVVADFDLTRPGAIGGTVTDAATGAPVPDITVALDGPGPAVTVTTDDEGRYFVDGLDAGEYVVTPAAPDGTEVVGGPRTVTITDAGEVRGTVDFGLREADAPSPTPSPTPEPTSEPSPTDPTTEPSGPSGPSPTAGPTDVATPTPAVPPGPGSSGPALPSTGGPPWWPAAAGLGLLLAGVALLRTSSNRSGEGAKGGRP
ncbi:hypothetical protein GCM10023340_10140 [Nocardioides marinquilinus]|uniref:Alpha-amylase n=1 Tax=Nocardioides marinquilinus TaxID=1210400 RepID=A0ABP9PB96_9ACTN